MAERLRCGVASPISSEDGLPNEGAIDGYASTVAVCGEQNRVKNRKGFGE